MTDVARNTDYRFDVQLAEGLAVEGWFYELTRGGDRFEVKNDKRALETGRVYVEFEHDPGQRGVWSPCGIARTEADCWIFALGDPVTSFVGVTTDRLAQLIARPDAVLTQPNGSCPTRGAGIRLSRLLGLDPAKANGRRAA